MGERGGLPGVDLSSTSSVADASSFGTRGRRRVERSVVGAAEPSLTPSAAGGDAATPHGQQHHQQNVLAALQQFASPAARLARSSGLTEKLYGALRRHYLASILDGLPFYILGAAPAPLTNAQLGGW